MGRTKKSDLNYVSSKIFDSKEQVNEWLNFSINPRSEYEIREKILSDKFRDSDVCFTYICRFSKLSESFIEELEVLSTGFISYFNLDDFDKVKEALYKEEGVTVIKNRHGDNNPDKLLHINNSQINSRIDWYYIAKHQTLSPEFISKHFNKIEKSLALAELSEIKSIMNKK